MKSVRDYTNKPGRRKSSGPGLRLGVRIQLPMLVALDIWIASQPDPKPSRPEAIRTLLAEALNR